MNPDDKVMLVFSAGIGGFLTLLATMLFLYSQEHHIAEMGRRVDLAQQACSQFDERAISYSLNNSVECTGDIETNIEFGVDL